LHVFIMANKSGHASDILSRTPAAKKPFLTLPGWAN
jgi:hypothetical protein